MLGSELEFHQGYRSTYRIWDEVLGEAWPIEKGLYESLLQEKKMIAIAIKDKTIAYISYEIFECEVSIYVIVVVPEHRRSGLATTLLNRVMHEAMEQGVNKATLCSFLSSPLWRAMPKDRVEAIAFFLANDWVNKGSSLDQICNIERYESPAFLARKHKPQGMDLGFVRPEETNVLLDFHSRYFPHWYPFYKDFIDQGKYENIVVLRINNLIVATCMLHYPGEIFSGSNWVKLMGPDCGAPSVLGVANEHRGGSLAFFIFDFAIKKLKVKGAKNAFINQSDAAAIYGRFGFSVAWDYVHLSKYISI
ncbi:GNAT family N-acetyltransferase [Pseudoalteromonas aurantia]|uniref:N-acetyltransferase domain-containing protein n=1 Tax=Pseudoalteromonas aurantia TaxID=43654 RepID=A0A5S3VAK5_9GAMM|nr:GNAT family N-acetyltransferase [Pseudoalteromonas aurantia]TMO64182.1 hypothetical protein CWC18_07070 [Pseudoalteromonas aurantia]TMO68538.1 hypothetical protein CWC19_08980 [Pseudoalteromonas aurantia]TMO75172.1 hypothetical protein CWC20_08590 [Pseudoalteromonas aurantia]